MALIHSKVSAVSVNAVDISTYCSSISLDRSADSHDVTTLGKTAHIYASGLTDGTISLEGFYDSTAVTGPDPVLRPLLGGPLVELIWMVEGTATGKPTETADCILTTYTVSAPVADMVTWKAEFQLSEAVAHATHA